MRRPKLVVAAVVLTATGATVALMNIRGSAGGSPAAEQISTARLQKQDLVVNDSFSGTLGYGEARDLFSERSGVVTAIAETTSVINPGGELFRIDFEPTVLLAGDVPAYRELDTSSADGPDIRQLEQGLFDASHGAGVTVDEDFTSATAAAVARWEQALGRAEPDGKVELGDVVFLPDPVRVSSVTTQKGARVASGATVLKATPTERVVEVGLQASRADELEPGTKVQLTLPDGTETPGTVASVGTLSDASDAAAAPGGGSATVPVVITLDDPAAAGDFESGTVDVDIERSRQTGAIVSPVTALVALAEGGYAVQLVDDSAPGGYRLVAVEIGTSTNQLVAITGDGIEAGAEVVVPG